MQILDAIKYATTMRPFTSLRERTGVLDGCILAEEEFMSGFSLVRRVP